MTPSDPNGWRPPEGYRLVLDSFRGGYADDFDANRAYSFARAEWDQPKSFRLASTHPAFNVAGLYYLPAPPVEQETVT